MSLRILQVSPQDIGGGAERVALDLHQGFLRRGVDARLMVRFSHTSSPGVERANIYEGCSLPGYLAAVLDERLSRQSYFKGRDALQLLLKRVVKPKRWYDPRRGLEDFNYPYSYKLLNRNNWKPDVINLHNLHSGYFDLRSLSYLSSHIPVFWTLHDTWAITGHCAHFVDCNKWICGCGDCPDLNRAPAVKHDKTRENWQQKKSIYSKSKLHVICPSKWLLSQVEKSMMQPVAGQVIRNGVDLSIFKPGNKKKARHDLGLPQDRFICLYLSTSGSGASPYKDYETIKKAVDNLFAGKYRGQLFFVCLGGGQDNVANIDESMKFVGRISDPSIIAEYYQSADVFLHAANADNFPCTILESFACGTPVVATSVGGITEQIDDGETGWLVPRGDSLAMAERIAGLMADRNLCSKMGKNAARLAARLYGLERQIDDYLKVYNEAITEYSGHQKRTR